MNELGRTLLWSTAQVTLLATFVAAVYAAVSRRRPATAVQVSAAGLAGCVVLTLTAFCPLPRWWTWFGGSRPEPAAFRPEPEKAGPGPDFTGGDLPRDDRAGGVSLGPVLHGIFQRAGQTVIERNGWTVNTTEIIAAVFLVGTVIGLVRLLAGLWLVGRYRRSGRLIDDTEIRDVTDSLRSALGCRRVSLRECEGLTGPATAGWRRPVLLLPAGWREWDEEERLAVLAHELAHIRRGDFAARLVAGLGVALHFYHPLLHWLSARLRLQQEFAADALAAPLAGGRACYLRALARLALRLDGPAPAWPAQAFFSSPRTLMRRVQMLRSKDGPNDRRAARGAVTALLVAGVLAASALRSPAREGAAEPKQPGTKAAPPSASLTTRNPAAEAFDRTYVPASARGVMVYRPAALFGSPGMEKLAAMHNRDLERWARQLGMKGEFLLKLQAVEQVTGEITFVRPKGDEKAAVMVALRSVRTVKDFDWVKLMRELAPGLAEEKRDGKTLYCIPRGALPFLGGQATFTTPDARTIVFQTDSDKPAVPGTSRPADSTTAKAAAPRPTWVDEWQMIHGDAIAIAVDLRGLDWAVERIRKDKSVDPALASLMENVESFAFGLDTKDGLRFEAWGCGKDKDAPEKLQELATALITRLAADLRDSGKDSGRTQQGEPIARLLSRLAEHSEWVDFNLADRGSFVHWRCKLEMTLEELGPCLIP